VRASPVLLPLTRPAARCPAGTGSPARRPVPAYSGRQPETDCSPGGPPAGVAGPAHSPARIAACAG